MTRAAPAVLVAVALLAAAACGPAPAEAAPPAPPSSTAAVPAPPAWAADGGAEPSRLRIPAIGVDSAVIGLVTDPAGTLVPPATGDVVGWFAAGPRPGDPGPALLAGHVDSRTAPGVFFRLAELGPGDRIVVDRADGSTVEFVVSRRSQVAKDAFPTDSVYAPTPAPELRLVTCGGSFDRSERSYRDNILIDAVPGDGSPWRVG